MISLPVIIAILSSLFFGVLAVIYSFKEDKTKRILKDKEKKYQHRLYETTILKEIQDRIGYSLDFEKVIEIIIASLDNMLPYSTASSLYLKEGQLYFDTNVKEPISKTFIIQVKRNMFNSLTAIRNVSAPQPSKLEEEIGKIIENKITGVALDENNNLPVSSTYNIPLVINGKIQGLINISSQNIGLYNEEDMAILHKITELAGNALSRLQSILAAENSKLVSLISSLEDGIFMVDLTFQITTINKKALDMLKINQPNPTLIDILSSLPSSYNFGDKIERSIKSNQKIEEKDIHHENKTIDIFIIPVYDSSPAQTQGWETKVIGASVIIRDTTREKSLTKMKEDFTRIIVHELRSPLTSIKASSELLTGQNKLNDDEKQKLLMIIKDQSDKMLDEISMILDAAKIETGVFTVQKTTSDLKKVIEELIETYRGIAQNKLINLVTNIDPFLPPVAIDIYQIRRVISNILSNSIKFTSSGGTITTRAWMTQEKIYISISDTGSGIPKDKLHLLFAKFAQIQSANATIGTGLGLYISKGIIDAHNGTISVESEINKGTTITLTLPLKAAPTITAIPIQTTRPLDHLPN